MSEFFMMARADEGWLTGHLLILGNSWKLGTRSILEAPPAETDGHQILWSGTLAESPFESSPLNFMKSGWDRFHTAIKTLPSGTMIRPHASHVISDAPSCMHMKALMPSSQVGLALSPASMLTPSMHRDAELHLERIFGMAAPHADALILEDLDHQCRPVDVGEGSLDGPLIGRLIKEHLPASCPIIIAGSDRDMARSWLGW